MLDEELFRDKLETALARVNPELELLYGLPTYTVDQICEEYLPMAERLRPYITETSLLLNNMIDEARPCSLRAPRQHCSISTMAPIRLSHLLTAPPAARSPVLVLA